MTDLQFAAILGTIFIILTIICVMIAARRSEAEWSKRPAVRLGFVVLSGVAFYKLVAAVGFIVLPAATIGAASYKLFEGTHETEACASCHVMQPMVTDLHDPTSTTLASRHSRNGWISDRECYTCHSGYGFAGSNAAKAEGYRHLVRYTTGRYEEPIASRTVFDQASCLNCHEKTSRFTAVNSHMISLPLLQANQMSCLNCHGMVHPSRVDRTPGSARYNELMATENNR